MMTTTGRIKTYGRLIKMTLNPLLYKPSKTAIRPISKNSKCSYELMVYG
jgi:hypothetical protein